MIQLLSMFKMRMGYYMNNSQDLGYYTLGSGFSLDDFAIDISYLFLENENSQEIKGTLFTK